MVRPRPTPVMETTERICRDIVEMHAEDAAFLWEMRQNAVSSHRFTLVDLAEGDERIEANLEGLVVAGPHGWQLLLEEMSKATPGAIFAGCVWALRAGDAGCFTAVVEHASSDAEALRAVASALGWVHAAGDRRSAQAVVERSLRELLSSSNASRRCAGVTALAACRGQAAEAEVQALLRDPDACVRARAARYAGQMGEASAVDALNARLGDESPDVCRAAAWSLCVLAPGHALALERLRADAGGEGEAERESVAMAARGLPAAPALSWMRELRRAERARVALRVAAAAGWPALLDDVLELMSADDDALSRLAGLAFSHVTGADLVQLELERTASAQSPANEPEHDDPAAPADHDAGGGEEDGDADVQDADVLPRLDEDEDLPLPDAELVARWWREHRDQLPPASRHLGGQPIAGDGPSRVLAQGNQSQRWAAAIELGRARRTPIFNTHQPGFAQARLLLGWS